MKTSFLTASKAFLRYKIDPNSQKQFKLRNRAVNQQRKLQDDPEVKVKKQRLTVDPSTNGHLSTTATFLADCPYIDSCLNVCTKPLSSVPKVAVVDRFNCIISVSYTHLTLPTSDLV